MSHQNLLHGNVASVIGVALPHVRLNLGVATLQHNLLLPLLTGLHNCELKLNKELYEKVVIEES